MPQQPPEPADVLARIADAADAAKALDECHKRIVEIYARSEKG